MGYVSFCHTIYGNTPVDFDCKHFRPEFSIVTIHCPGQDIALEMPEAQLRSLHAAIQRRLAAIDSAVEVPCCCTDPVRPEEAGCAVHVAGAGR